MLYENMNTIKHTSKKIKVLNIQERRNIETNFVVIWLKLMEVSV